MSDCIALVIMRSVWHTKMCNTNLLNAGKWREVVIMSTDLFVVLEKLLMFEFVAILLYIDAAPFQRSKFLVYLIMFFDFVMSLWRRGHK